MNCLNAAENCSVKLCKKFKLFCWSKLNNSFWESYACQLCDSGGDEIVMSFSLSMCVNKLRYEKVWLMRWEWKTNTYAHAAPDFLISGLGGVVPEPNEILTRAQKVRAARRAIESHYVTEHRVDILWTDLSPWSSLLRYNTSAHKPRQSPLLCLRISL